jgi:hypothetical protein
VEEGTVGASRLPTTSRILVLVGVVLALTGSCTGSVNSGDAVSERSSTSTSDRVAMPEPVGPLAGLEWPSGSVPKEMLLHDDGGRLWAVPLDGEPTLIWTHPAAHVYDIAAAPSGHQLAYSVRLPAKNARDPSWVLYLLDADGRVRTVDVVRGFRYIASPVFLTPPTELDGPVRLYWIRGSEEVSPETGRLMTEVMVLGDKAPTHVDVPLRYEEAPWEIHGYAGSWMFTVTLFRTNDVPTRLEVLQNVDFGQAATDASLTLWGDLEKPVNTDAFTGVAWLTPTEYVVLVVQEFYPERFSLRLFRFGCEQYGSHVVYRGRGIDPGYSDAPWPLLPAGPDHVFVLRRRDVQRVASGREDSAPWLMVDVKTGEIHVTDARWIPPGRLDGWWTFVQPASHMSPPTTSPDCSDLTWTYP